MNKILINVHPNSPMVNVAKELSEKYNKLFTIQNYNKAYNLLHMYKFPLYDQLVSDGPGYNLQDSFKENIYAKYEVVVVHLLSLNIIAEAIINGFDCILIDSELDKKYRLRGAFAFANQNFKNFYLVDNNDPSIVTTNNSAGKHTEILWRKND